LERRIIGPPGIAPDRLRRTVFSAVLFAFVAAGPAAAQAFRIDLLDISERTEARYYLAENGMLPPKYILLGGISLYPNFLRYEVDTRRLVTEYDPVTGHFFRYRVPGDHVFASRVERDGAYFTATGRNMGIPGIGIEPGFIEDEAETIRRLGFRKVWISGVRYNLERDRSGARKGGLIDLNIPIKLPKQIEWLIGDGEQTRLNVSGREKITIGGTSRWCANCPVTEGRPKQQKFPDLDMEQQLSVNLQGNIGEKIMVNIDHSSMGGGMPSTNRVRLNYQGLEDEIIRSIEMGDTDLTLSGAQLISYSGAAKGLFGIKVKAQLGVADLTVIASKEEGETATGSYSGSGGQSSEVSIADYGYIKRQYFYFETPGASFAEPLPGFIGHPGIRYYPVYGGTNNDEVEIFISLDTNELQNYQGGAKFQLRACVDPENDGVTGAEEDHIEQWYALLEENNEFGQGDYSLIQLISADAKIRYMGIRLNQALPDGKALAIRYRCDAGTPDNAADDFNVGDYKNFEGDPAATVYLAELICPLADDMNDPVPDTETGLRKAFWSTWNMMFRNVYSLGSAGQEDAAIRVRIENVGTIIGTKDIQDETNTSYLRIFGLDQENTEGVRIPDNLIDDKKGIVNYFYGYIMFPWYQPFDLPKDELASYLAPDSNGDGFGDPTSETYDQADSVLFYLESNGMIYTDYRKIQTNPAHRYNILVEATSGSRTFQLNAFDIIEGTEVVTVDGEKLSSGTDYTIDYSTGTVTLMGDRLLTMTPDSKVSIDYQHKPMMGGGKTSLLGIGANFNLSTNSRINAVFLYNSVGMPRLNPRLGDEPTRNMAGDINGSFQFYPGWMTSAVNLLPRVDTDAASSLNISGEIALSIPNPNTKGEAFVDDMEGIEDSDQVVMVRRLWYEASPPIDPANSAQYLDPMPEDMDFYWYNPVRDETSPQYKLTTSKRDLNPGLDTRENSAVSSLFLKTVDPSPGQWCGVMTGFPGGLDLSTAQYLEIWVNDYNTDPETRAGILHIDFGRISEDFHQPELGNYDDEREVDWTILDDDGFDGEESVTKYPTVFSSSTWDAVRRIYRGINSRNGNNQHDSEDLNRNSRFDERNEYYSLTLDLSDSAVIDVQRDFDRAAYSSYWGDEEKTKEDDDYDPAVYPINEKKAWRMYRIDMSGVEMPSGIPPRLDAVQHIRIWVENIDEVAASSEYSGETEHMIELGGLTFVGSRWEFDKIRELEDEAVIVAEPEMKVRVGAINNKDDPSLYYSPYDVDVKDGIEAREQTLLIEVENFLAERSFRLRKQFLGGGQDFQQYREIQFYVRGDRDLTSHDGDIVDFYLQLAYDSLNYYEVAVPLTVERAGHWNLVTVTLSDLTDMKFDAEPGQIVETVVRDAEDDSRSYPARLRGNPSLFQVRYMFAGLRNRSGVAIQDGQVWFNDLALGNVRKDIDHAERASVAASFGNVISVNGNYQHTGPEFRTLRQKTGSGVTSDSYAFSGKTEINHFVPTARFDLPVTFRWTETQSKPKYLPQKDVEITDSAVQDSLKSVRNSYTVSLAISRRGSKNPIMRNVFDKLKTGLSYSKNASYSPTAKDTSWALSGNANYQVEFDKDRQWNLFKGVKWRYWLTNLSMKASGARSVKRGYSLSGDEFVKRPSSYSCAWDNEISAVYDPFESVKLNYRRAENRNLAVQQMIYGIDVGILTSFRQSLDMRYQPRNVFLISQFNPTLEYNTSYEEDLKPGVRQGDDPGGTRDAFNNRNISIVFDVDVGKYVMKFGKKIGVLETSDVSSASKLGSQRAEYAQRKTDFEDKMKDQLTTRDDDRAAAEPGTLPDEPAEQIQGEKPPAEPAKGGAAETPADTGLRRPRITDSKDDPGLREIPADSAAVDSTAVVPAARKADPMLLVKHVVGLLSRLDPVKSRIDIDRRNSFDRLYDRADLLYQMGFSTTSGTDGALGGADSDPLRQTDRIGLNLRSGVNITSNLSANINFNSSKRKDESDSRVTETEEITWPDINLNWKGLHNWGLLKKHIKSSDMTISYIERTSKRAGSETEGYQFNPSWNMAWFNSLASTISLSYAKKTTMERNQELWDKSWSVNLELKYDVKGKQGIGLPLPFLRSRKLKFDSNLNTSVNIVYTNTEKYNVPPTTSISVAPRLTYTFSRNVSGNLTMNYRRTAGGIYGYINHEVGMHATAEFKF